MLLLTVEISLLLLSLSAAVAAAVAVVAAVRLLCRSFLLPTFNRSHPAVRLPFSHSTLPFLPFASMSRRSPSPKRGRAAAAAHLLAKPIERGHMYVLFRPKVDVEEAHAFKDGE